MIVFLKFTIANIRVSNYWSFILPVCFVFFVFSCSDPSPQLANVKRMPSRVAVIGPSIAEILEELDLLVHVHALGKFGHWPEPVRYLPVVGGYKDPNAEQILSLDIDTVLNVKSQASITSHARLRKLGIQVIELDTTTFEGIFESIDIIGEIFGKKPQATVLVKRLQDEVRLIEQRATGLEKKRVLFVVDNNPVYVAGPGSHIDRMIQLVGGENVAYDVLSPYQQLSLEAILQRKPEVIIDTSNNQPGALRGKHVGHWGRWQFLPAVQNNSVYWIDPSQLVIPAIRLSEMTQLMGKLIHPEVFGEPVQSDYHKYVRQD